MLLPGFLPNGPRSNRRTLYSIVYSQLIQTPQLSEYGVMNDSPLNMIQHPYPSTRADMYSCVTDNTQLTSRPSDFDLREDVPQKLLALAIPEDYHPFVGNVSFLSFMTVRIDNPHYP